MRLNYGNPSEYSLGSEAPPLRRRGRAAAAHRGRSGVPKVEEGEEGTGAKELEAQGVMRNISGFKCGGGKFQGA